MGLAERRAEIASRIANGHAYDKHVNPDHERNANGTNEFADLGIVSKEDFEKHINSVLEKDDLLCQSGAKGRACLYDADTNTTIMLDPNRKDFGTCIRPTSQERHIDVYRYREVQGNNSLDVRANGLPDYDKALAKEEARVQEADKALAEMQAFLSETRADKRSESEKEAGEEKSHTSISEPRREQDKDDELEK